MRVRVQWILHYNLRWLLGDLIAGITVGLVLVPQAMVRSLASCSRLRSERGESERDAKAPLLASSLPLLGVCTSLC